MHQPVKLQIVSRNLPFGLNYDGSSTYLMDFLRYLQQKDFEIECILLDASPGGKLPWYVLPSTLRKIMNISARYNFRFSYILIKYRSWLDWLIAPLWLVYVLLPEKIKFFYLVIKNKLRSIYRHVASSTDNQSQTWDALPTLEELNFVKSQFARFKPDVVIANYSWLGGVLDTLTHHKTVLKVIVTHDIIHQRVDLFKKAETVSNHSDWDWQKESTQLRKAQVLLAIHEEDARELKEMAPQSDVICMPMSAVCHSHTVRQVPGRCLFVGSAADHNFYGLQWFLGNVWPIVVQSAPYCSLHICGTVSDLIRETFPNVRFLGRVDNLEPEYSAAEVCLVPLPVGSGLKIKLVEALSYGRACVSTSIGVQGLWDIAGSAVLVADTAENFAAAVHLLLTNPDKRQWMEEQACRYVTERLSPEAAYQPFVERIQQHLYQTANRL